MPRLLLFYPFIAFTVQVSAMMCVALPVIAAPQSGPEGMAFYEPPATLPATGEHGDLIRYRKISLDIPDGPDVNAWLVLYRSTDALDVPNVVTGTVLVPATPWRKDGDRPVISYGVGTQGLGQMCATSLQLQAGTCYELANLAAGLRAGYAMVVTDYPGYTNGDIPSYMNGFAQGHAALDIISAARQIPGNPISSAAQVAIWGYSQGGQTAAWAGQLQRSYMPDLDLVGVAAGGVPADLLAIAHNIDGKVGSSFLLQVYMGLYSQYPDEIPLMDIANADGLEAIDAAMDKCMFEALIEYMYVETSELTKGNLSLEQLMEQYDDIRRRVESMTLGRTPIEVPVYMYHGTADPMIPLEQALTLRDAYCGMGVQTTFAVFETAEHVITMFQGAQYVLSWIGERFDGNPLNGGDVCSSAQRPVSDMNDPAGDFIITLDNWHLDSTVHLGRLNQDVPQPETSTYSADCNVSALTVENGAIEVPSFDANVRIIIPLKAGFKLEQVGEMSGNLELSNDGILSINGSVKVDFFIDGVGLTRRKGIPFSVNTSQPVEIPLNYKGPVSDLGNGKITFSGQAQVPLMGGGPMAPFFSLLMSGPIDYTFRIFPKAPRIY